MGHIGLATRLYCISTLLTFDLISTERKQFIWRVRLAHVGTVAKNCVISYRRPALKVRLSILAACYTGVHVPNTPFSLFYPYVLGCVRMCMREYMCVCVHVYMRVCVCVRARACVRACVRACAHVYMLFTDLRHLNSLLWS